MSQKRQRSKGRQAVYPSGSDIFARMPQDRESWLQQCLQYLFFTLAASFVVVFYLHVLHANQATVALSFLILILFTAFQSRLAYSIYLSFLCAGLYNYYFLPPVRTLTIADPENLIALIVFLAAGISVNHLSAKERRHAHSLAMQTAELEKLYAFSQRLLLEDKLQQLSAAVPTLIAQSFQMHAVALYLPDPERSYIFDPQHLLSGMETLHGATQPGGLAARATAGVRIIPLMLGMRPLGVLAMTESSSTENFYDAIASLVAVSIERASALERNSRSEAAREGELLRTALLDSITHELRTPLTGIQMAATTLTSDAILDESSRLDLLAVISEESTRMNALIDEAVTMAQLSAGAITLRQEARDFKSILESVLENLSGALRGREVILKVAPQMPLLPMDADLIRRVLKHLLENANQYSPARSPVWISAAFTGNKLQVSVRNEGPGIAEEEQQFVFDRFFRGANGTAHPDGTGMGLAIVKTIIEAHQGRISVASAPGYGVTFSFWIPQLPDTPP